MKKSLLLCDIRKDKAIPLSQSGLFRFLIQTRYLLLDELQWALNGVRSYFDTRWVTMLHLFFLLIFQTPAAQNQWQVPFVVQKAALSPSGLVALTSSGTLYTYNSAGAHLQEINVGEQINYIWIDNDNHIWVVRTSALTVYSSEGHIQFEKKLEPIIKEPFPMGNCLGLVNRNAVSIYSIQDKKDDAQQTLVAFSFSFEDIYSINHSAKRVFICDTKGNSKIWYPFQEASYDFLKEKKITYVSEDYGYRAILLSDKNLQVYTPRKMWERQLSLDINQKPLWLENGKDKALIVLSEDRVLRVFSRLGLEYNRKLYSYRPDHLIKLDESRCLVSFKQANLIAEYDYKQNQFKEYQLPTNLTHIVRRGIYLLQIDREGHIKITTLTSKTNQTGEL